jgi:predicted MFS family arabinose efflux permease
MGAIVTDTLGWAWIFLLNVPLGAVVWLVARYGLSESRADRLAAHLDLPGAVASGLALSAILLGLTEGNDYGWTSLRVVGLFAAAAAAAAAFLWIERRSSAPLVDLSRLRTRAVAGPNVVILLATSVMCSLFFFLALYLQTVLGGSALSAGVQLLPLTGTIVVVAPLAGRLADRMGARVPVTAGMALLATALLGLSTLRTDSALWTMFPWLALAGLGIGLTTTPTTTAAMGGGAGEHGIAAGLLNTFRATGLALGIAVMGAVLAGYGGGAAASADSFVDGFSAAVTVNAGIALLTAVIAAATLSGRPRPCPGRSGLPSRRNPSPAPERAR